MKGSFLFTVGSGARPASYSMGTEGSYSGGKAADREAEHSPMRLHGVRDNFTYTLPEGKRPLRDT